MFERRTPLFDTLAAYAGKGYASFHTPGHKGHAGILDGLQLLSHDLTELPETASLYDGGDAIEESENLAAEAFESAVTVYSAGGCTLCIQAMLLLGASAGGSVLFARNSHRSAVNTAALLGLQPIWAWPTGENGQITPEDISKELIYNKNVQSVYITSPDYYGFLADIPAISAVCRKAGIPLLVDNAHGSHLGAFGLHPLSLGASLTADSAHKTLPVLTGGAMLHIGFAEDGINPLFDHPTAKAAMALFGSTSPGFPVLASIDLARSWWSLSGRQEYRQTAATIQSLHHTAELENIAVTSEMRDPARLTLNPSAIGVDGLEAAEFFRSCGCEPEYADNRFVVFIITPFNTEEELERLHEAIRRLPTEIKSDSICANPILPYLDKGIKPSAVLTPREALLAPPCETIPVAQAEGRISARTICPCPPGIPVVVPGELINGEIARKLFQCGNTTLVVLK